MDIKPTKGSNRSLTFDISHKCNIKTICCHIILVLLHLVLKPELNEEQQKHVQVS